MRNAVAASGLNLVSSSIRCQMRRSSSSSSSASSPVATFLHFVLHRGGRHDPANWLHLVGDALAFVGLLHVAQDANTEVPLEEGAYLTHGGRIVHLSSLLGRQEAAPTVKLQSAQHLFRRMHEEEFLQQVQGRSSIPSSALKLQERRPSLCRHQKPLELAHLDRLSHAPHPLGRHRLIQRKAVAEAYGML